MSVSGSNGSGSVRSSYFQSELTRFHVKLRVHHVTVRLTYSYHKFNYVFKMQAICILS